MDEAERTELLIRLDENMKTVMNTQAQYLKLYERHDTELKEIRAWKNKITGATGVIGASVLGLLTYIWHHKGSL